MVVITILITAVIHSNIIKEHCYPCSRHRLRLKITSSIVFISRCGSVCCMCRWWSRTHLYCDFSYAFTLIPHKYHLENTGSRSRSTISNATVYLLTQASLIKILARTPLVALAQRGTNSRFSHDRLVFFRIYPDWFCCVLQRVPPIIPCGVIAVRRKYTLFYTTFQPLSKLLYGWDATAYSVYGEYYSLATPASRVPRDLQRLKYT